jgi:malate dehydrogenase (oxaloacetate-decarboxylating)(NADP+)
VNALELVGKRMDEIKVVVNGAGASGIACAEHYVSLGVKRENVTLCDTKGVVYKGRKEGRNPYKERFAHDTPRVRWRRRSGEPMCFWGCQRRAPSLPR